MTKALLAATSSFVIWTFLCHSSFGFRHLNHHALAAIAQIWMGIARADGWPMPPAARALLVRGFGDRSAHFFRLLDRQVTYNEEFFQFLLSDFLGHIRIRVQNDSGLQRVADQFFLPGALYA